MVYYSFITVVLLISIAYADYTDCGSEVGSIVSLSVSNCDIVNDDSCILKRNTNATIDISFKSKTKSDNLTAEVHGVVLGVAIPFQIPNPDGCTSGVTCPIGDGTTYNYKASLPVSSNYPRVSVDVKWELQDDSGKDVVCVLIPAKIR